MSDEKIEHPDKFLWTGQGIEIIDPGEDSEDS